MQRYLALVMSTADFRLMFCEILFAKTVRHQVKVVVPLNLADELFDTSLYERPLVQVLRNPNTKGIGAKHNVLYFYRMTWQEIFLYPKLFVLSAYIHFLSI